MRKTLSLFALGLLVMCTSLAQAQETINFEDVAPGTIVEQVFGEFGTGPIGVFGSNPDLDAVFGAGSNAAVIFDSENFTVIVPGGPDRLSKDTDLGTPNETFGGPGEGPAGEAGMPFQNDVAKGHLLIINEVEDFEDRNMDGMITGADSPVTQTDDADNPNEPIVLDFSAVAPVTVYSIFIMDVEAVEGSATVEFFDNLMNPIGAPFVLPRPGDNGAAANLDLGPTSGVWTMRILLNGSGAIDDVVFAQDVFCGDGAINLPGETCEPPGSPAGASGNTCREDCTVCGDGIQDAGEACDDGNNIAGDGCENDCTVTLICGDGAINLPGETCEPPGSPAGASGNTCREDCTVCGDGIQDAGEACDDGNNIAGDGCENDCTVTLICGDGAINLPGETCEPPGSPAGASGNTCREDCTVCGDGIQDAGEACDDGNNIADDGCENDCTVTLICGDGAINLPGETCEPPGSPAGASGNTCREDCTVCGDGIEDAGEECDDGNAINGDGCENDCTDTPICGDGEINLPGETCDPPGSPAGANGNDCREDCTVCGDGIVDAGEDCDDGNAINGDECQNDCTILMGGEGCTPGYWKVPQHWDSWIPTGYATGDLVGGVFTDANAYPDLADDTLVEALAYGGGRGVMGAARILLRAAVASLLNSSHPDVAFDWSEAGVIADVNAALASGDRSTMLSLAGNLDNDNNDGCPLN